MKLMRSPIAVGVLVVIALLLVGNSLKNSRSVQNMWNRTFTKQSAPKPAPAPKPTAKPAAAAKPTTARSASARQSTTTSPVPQAADADSPTIVPVDVAVVRADAARWTESPRRDPFWRRPSATDRKGKSAKDLLSLKAIWRQTDSTLAVINNRVVSEGEDILGFNIATIEIDRVWVEGPDGREVIEFISPSPTTADNSMEPMAEPDGVTPPDDTEDQDDDDFPDPEPGPQRVVT
jgi:hypothetical protein